MEEMEESQSEQPTTRTRFLKGLGMTVAAVVGAGVFAKNAFADPLCCSDPSCPSCPGGNWCSCSCPGCVAVCLGQGHCIACPC